MILNAILFAEKRAMLQAPNNKIPNYNIQITNKSQIPMFNEQNVWPATSSAESEGIKGRVKGDALKKIN